MPHALVPQAADAVSAIRRSGSDARPGRSHIRREQIVPLTPGDTFAFFADARNLDRLTPPWVGFKILTPTPIPMGSGTLIDYSIRVRGVRLRWRTRITVWDPPFRFADEQVRGPYRVWRHVHHFEPAPGGTRVIDEVEYAAPLAWLTHPLLVDRDVSRIFDHRAAALARELGSAPPGGPRPR